ncbi:MAG: helix-turn-helix transcriptional regulator [Akkermansia sp.]|nr:helix-turn-helix transcriptional regulator [Akkermansia sp.]
MTIEEIKNILAERGMTQQELATALSISYSSMRQILSGATKLTEQLSKHIEYVLNKRKQQTFIYTVDLPEGTVRSWVPGFDTLSEEEQQKTLRAICHNVLAELAAKGAERLTEQEREALKELAPTPYGQTYEPYA